MDFLRGFLGMARGLRGNEEGGNAPGGAAA